MPHQYFIECLLNNLWRVCYEIYICVCSVWERKRKWNRVLIQLLIKQWNIVPITTRNCHYYLFSSNYYYVLFYSKVLNADDHILCVVIDKSKWVFCCCVQSYNLKLIIVILWTVEIHSDAHMNTKEVNWIREKIPHSPHQTWNIIKYSKIEHI